MQFIQFKQQLEKFIIFGLQDIRKIEGDFDLRRLSEWQNKNYIKQVRRGYYIFSDLDINEKILYLIANKIYPPAYVSLETALSYYNLIPEGVYKITSVSSKKTNKFKTPLGEFVYKSIKPELMFGYKLVEYKNQIFKIAEIEKTILDYFYTNPNIKTREYFAELRFNEKEFKELVDKNKLEKYLQVFNNKNLNKRIKDFLKFINYA